MEKHEDESLITKAAKVIGGVAGRVVALAKSKPAETAATDRKDGRFAKTQKSRLPRKAKKAMKKAAAQVNVGG